MSVTLFSAVIRDATRAEHTAAEESPFVADLLGGRLDVAAFTRYTEQLWFVYGALERAAERLADDPVAGAFVRPELLRLPALERDLEHLAGPGWREGARELPATAAYTARITEVAAGDRPCRFVAHHYTRYLGDLSGGQVIRDVAERRWGFAHKGDGVRFYVFDAIANPALFKREYRLALDAMPLDEVDRQRVVDECRLAFRLNSAMFRDLGALFPLTA